MLNRTWGTVHRICKTTLHIQELEVEIDGKLASAVNYRELGRDVSPGDLVELNTTAVDLDLGTGGCTLLSAPSPKDTARAREGRQRNIINLAAIS